jgi:hypothetical protein
MGNVIERNDRTPPAPSILADSYRSSGIVTIAA